MSTIDLTVLGIVLRHPMSAHEIVRFVEHNGVSNMIKISAPAIYKSCKRLYASGCLDGECVREGEAPEKTVYTLNAKGEARFLELMEHYSSTYKPYFLDFNAFIWNIEMMEYATALKMLENLQTQIEQAKLGITMHERAMLSAKTVTLSFAAEAIIRQYSMMFSTLAEWISLTIVSFKNRRA